MLKLSKAIAGWRPAQTNSGQGPIALLEACWEEIIGSQVAQHSHPARVADGTLTITTRSSAWSHQLSFLAEHLLRVIGARLPDAGIERLRFRVGTIPARRRTAGRRQGVAVSLRAGDRPDSASPAEALARFRRDVEQRHGARREQGWKECVGCGALVEPACETLCSACVAARSEQRTAATAQLMFEAPWLGYFGTAALVEGLQQEEYERIRSLLLAHWWEMLARARALKQLSRDGRERVVASSYVLLRSKIPPENIVPATVRSVLGDELHELLYGDPSREGGAVKNQKRRM
jgi:Dna[CI] antecedent, DciA